MVYLLFIFVCCNYLAYLRRLRELDFKSMLLYSSPVIFFWCILIGGQYGVGTDYFNYLDMFTNGDHLDYIEDIYGEYGFSCFVKTLHKLNIRGQSIFLIIAFIWSLIFMFAAFHLLGSKYLYLCLFVFIVFTGGFNNQMNLLKQYSSIYIMLLAFMLLFQKHYILALSFLLLCPLFHNSSLIAIFIGLFFYFIATVFRRRIMLYGILLIGIVCNFWISEETISLFIPYFDQYSNYMNRGIENSDLLIQLTKCVYLPLFAYSIHLFPKMNLNKFLEKLFVFGICCYAMKLSVMSLELLSRMGLYFEFFSCIPLLCLLLYYRQKGSISMYYFLIIYLLLPYSLKVTFFARAEYLYDSILLK